VFISSFSAHRVLGGDFAYGKTAVSVRKSLLVLQSALSIGLIIAAATVYLQLDFLRNLPVGYARTARLKVSNVETEKTFAQNSLGLFRALEKIPGVLSATPVDIDLTEKQNAGIVQIRIPGQQQELDSMAYAGVGYDAAQTLGLELLAGRDFSPQHPSDWFQPSGEGAGASKAAAAVLITQSALISAGYQDPEQGLGKIWTFNAGRYAQMQGRIVGVVRDIQIGASGAPRFSVVFGCGLSWTDKSSIMIHSNTPFSPHLHQQIRRLLRERLGLKLIVIESMDEKYSALYQRHRQLARVIAGFSGLAVFLTCIGVLGLAAHTAQRRSREIAMRKLLGASRLAIINLLAVEYLRLIGIGLLMAFPLAFVVMSDWLSQFSDRIGQSSITYLMALALVTGVTWLTISGVAFRTASARPSRVLHYE